MRNKKPVIKYSEIVIQKPQNENILQKLILNTIILCVKQPLFIRPY